MPWLTVHIAFPLLLGAAWSINVVISKFLEISQDKKDRWLLFIKVALMVMLFLLTLLNLLGNHPPFQGKTQPQLQATNFFIFLLILLSGAGYLVFKDLKTWKQTHLDHSIIDNPALDDNIDSQDCLSVFIY